MTAGLFRYPDQPRPRRHGPGGYSLPEEYRPWLRDEFDFACAYCLFRETWLPAGESASTYFRVIRNRPENLLRYDNLLYACRRCAEVKGRPETDDPLQVLTMKTIRCDADGTLQCGTVGAARLVDHLDLNAPEWREFRRQWALAERLAARHDLPFWSRLQAWPDDLPPLPQLKPPGGNTRRDGLATAYTVRHAQGALPHFV